MSGNPFLVINDSEIDLRVAARVMSGAHTELLAATMALLPESASDETKTATAIAGYFNENDPMHTHKRRDPGKLLHRLRTLERNGYVISTDPTSTEAAGVGFKRTELGDVTAIFGATMLREGLSSNVPMDAIIPSAIHGDLVPDKPQNPISARLSAVSLITTLGPGTWIEFGQFRDLGSLNGISSTSVRTTLKNMVVRGVIKERSKHVRGCTNRVQYKVITGDSSNKDFPSFMNTLMRTTVNILDGQAIEEAPEVPAKVVEEIAQKGFLGHVLKRTQPRSAGAPSRANGSLQSASSNSSETPK